MIPEKFNRQPGQNYYSDMNERIEYTANNLIDCYVNSINSFLEEHSFSTVIIVGSSEGCCLLPLIYERINDKNSIKALVSISFGGLSWYESFLVLTLRNDIPPDYKIMYQYFVDIYKPGEDTYPDSYEESIFGITYKWFNSIRNIKPIDYYYHYINIPVLFIHGDNDYNIPVESTVYIQDNLPDKPFNYMYYRWDHQPRTRNAVLQFRKELAEWIINHS